MTFIDGSFRQVGPAKNPEQTPEQEQGAAAKLEKSRANRKSRKAQNPAPELDQLADVVESEPVAPSVSSQNPEQASAGIGEPPTDAVKASELSDDAALATATAKLEAQKVQLRKRLEALGVTVPADTHIKQLRMMVDKAEDRAIASRAADVPEPTMPDSGEFDAATVVYQRASKQVAELEAEAAGIAGGIEDAVAAEDFGTLAELRNRQAYLPAEIEAARFRMLKAKLAMEDAETPLKNAARQIARAEAANAAEKIKEANQAIYAAQGEANAADDAWREHKLTRSNTFQQLEALKADMLKAPPAQHRPPVSMSGSQGADNSGLAPMPRRDRAAES